MLSVTDLSLSYGARTLFKEVSFTLVPGNRLALAGPNGAGKSTMLKLLMGLETPDSGTILKSRGTTVGYLPQEGVSFQGRTVYQEAELAFSDMLEVQAAYDACSELLGSLDPSSEKYAEVLLDFGELQQRLDHHQPALIKPRIETILAGLGFSASDLERQTSDFSGGWQMRLALAKLLLQEPSILLLDEPTNHLDIETIQWLERWLQSYPGAILLISHDRRFLDVLTNKTLAFHAGRVEMYAGNYSFFVKESALRREHQKIAALKQAKEIEKTKQFIDRFRASANKATLVQSRVKMLEKVEVIEIDEEEDEVNFRFPQPPPSGQTVMKVEKLTKAYDPGKPIFENVDFTISKGDRIAMVGVNGAGKTTFSKILAGVENPTSGVRTPGYQVQLAYYSQDHADSMMPERTVLETAEQGLRGEAAASIRNLLGCFLFRGDDVLKRVGVLSGGERGRLALCRILSTPANFLVLDEPTNHLDMRSQAVLQRALADYTGAYVIVSHNRDFLDPIVNKVLEFRPGKLPRLFLGNVSDYLDKVAAEREAEARARQFLCVASSSQVSAGQSPVPVKLGRKELSKLKEELRSKIRPLKAELTRIETVIADQESLKESLTEKMQDPALASDAMKVQEIAMQYPLVEAELEQLYTKWAEITEAMEPLEVQLQQLNA